jgi:protein-S-isoprenylcysteine O-methyltransferase Ste14
MSLFNNESLRNFFAGRRRFQLAWIFAAFLIICAKQYPSALGIAICFLGASLRFISSGFLRKEAKLAVGGPYSHTRNPLYLGTFIMVLGATFSVGAYLLTFIAGFVFYLNYHYVIAHEEQKLPSYFGPSYLRYCELVPRFWPRFSTPAQADLEQINSDPAGYVYSYPLAKQNKAFEAYVSFFAIVLGMYLLVFLKSLLR